MTIFLRNPFLFVKLLGFDLNYQIFDRNRRKSFQSEMGAAAEDLRNIKLYTLYQRIRGISINQFNRR
jgi:hypothetical protein